VYLPGAKQRRVVPVGGNTLFVTNVDYRLRSPFLAQLLQFNLFTDVGTVWNRSTQTNGVFRPLWTPGLGVRVFSPIGPIQVNAGYNPYPPVPGPALYTPNRQLAESGYTGVYCAVPQGTPPSEAPKSQLKPDPTTGKPTWQQDPTTQCAPTFQPNTPKTFFGRLTFTFSIGSDF
jgi:hypothetical protein